MRRAFYWIGEVLGALCVFGIPYLLAVIGWGFFGG